MRIRTVISFVAIIFCTYEVPAQKNRIELEVSTQEIGKWQDSSKVEALVYSFNMRVEDYRYDSLSNATLVNLRRLKKNNVLHPSKGEILTIDNNTNEIMWSKKVNYNFNVYHVSGHYIFQTALINNPITECFHTLTGKSLWEIQSSIVAFSNDNKVGLGFKMLQHQPSLIKNDMFGIDLETGGILWTKSINLNKGLAPYIFHTSDTSLIFVSNGVHHINMKDGSGWSIEESSTKGVGMSQVLAGVVNYSGYGDYIDGYTRSNIVRNVHSNILIIEDTIYFASAENFLKIDLNGNILCKIELPKKLTSMSALIQSKDGKQIYLLNFGRGHVNNYSYYAGKSFIASFGSNDCNLRYLNELFPDEKEFITNYQLGENHLVCGSENKVIKIELDSGNYIESVQLEKGNGHQNVTIPSSYGYVSLNDSMYLELNTNVDNQVDVWSSSNNEIVWFQLNDSLGIMNYKKDTNVLAWKFYAGDYSTLFDYKSGQFIAIDENNIERARFTGSHRIRKYNNLVFYSKGNQLFKLNTDQFLEKKL
jgi:hypothetical protein